MRFDHIAITAADVAKSVQWYKDRFNADVLYQDESWAFLQFGGLKLALVNARQHPPHLALSVTEAQLAGEAAKAGQKIETHRDGTCGIYVQDPAGNSIEFICYPPGQTAYGVKK
jgi:catechol 2,3-dioxygenase-like lactoylglutathione lyase family enzyme